MYCIFFSASYGSQLAAGFAYAAGPKFAWLGAVKWFSGAGTIIRLIIFIGILILLLLSFRHNAHIASARFTFFCPAYPFFP